MARFPYYAKNVSALGRLLATASLNPELAEQLRNDPKSVLRSAGLPPQATELLRFKVVEQMPGAKCIALPFRLNERKLQSSNREYLTALSNLVTDGRLN
ncbi:hypothetical protein [Roseibium salinum]|uniref:Uncharacterized protein n=1 Tax=Roseibium salinum TaxID=1604349 RepID=A0ABT3R1F1_9HYPH|nr:hypothetical protein [Roseibium sp. DSM 29163]MCX2722903.1 hypothetical protein [Roseibium sp. DSM 29163]MDN3719171.1 hypothetical protein [Roseibium salinum]